MVRVRLAWSVCRGPGPGSGHLRAARSLFREDAELHEAARSCAKRGLTRGGHLAAGCTNRSATACIIEVQCAHVPTPPLSLSSPNKRRAFNIGRKKVSRAHQGFVSNVSPRTIRADTPTSSTDTHRSRLVEESMSHGIQADQLTHNSSKYLELNLD